MHNYKAEDIEIERYGEYGWEWSYIDDEVGNRVTKRTNANGEGLFLLMRDGWHQVAGTMQYTASKTKEEMVARLVRGMNRY
jgi:hypothetical protein|nr:MAG TPA: hypothetical protein [Caudoviricetes sp.]DAT64128.1 MAG TPA: hypothetical protein [Caudoviricetes sp.]DAX36180.1 MAG TPA: hypothetical protein [Caudoviricetes sp.]